MFAGNFPPMGWAFCDGQMMAISENDTLFNLIGTTYGGDGVTTFGLPDLRGRVPLHNSSTYVLGEKGGQESVILTTNQIPNHTHQALAASTGQVLSPAGAILASAQSAQTGVRIYSTLASTNALHAGSIDPQGGSQPHDNIQPSLAINFIISLYGVYPQQN